MTHREDQFPQEETDTQSLTLFNSEVFIQDALGWGHTPIKNLPEQAIVCEHLVNRIVNSCPSDINPLSAEYMAAVYSNRFHIRQDRNAQAYESRLNHTPYAQLAPEVRERRDKSMIGAGSVRDELLFQRDAKMGSGEIARITNAYVRNTEECQEKRNEVIEAAYEMDDTTYVPDTRTRWKVRGSDVITLHDMIKHDSNKPYFLFVTSKEDCVVMPRDDTWVQERHSYVLDLEAFSRHEPEAAILLQSLDVVELGPDEWMRQATEIWTEFAQVNPILDERSTEYLYDQSTTFYTVNKKRLEAIAVRDESLEDYKAQHRSGSQELNAHIAKEQQDVVSRKIGGVTMREAIDEIVNDLTAGRR